MRTAAAKGLKDIERFNYQVVLEGDSSLCFIIVIDRREEAVAEIQIRRVDDTDVWQVKSSSAQRGWGPFVYDLALEFIYIMDDGDGSLTPDRDTVSASAKRVWDFFLKRRRDVQSIPLKEGDYMYQRYPEGSPLSFRYMKSHSRTLKTLEREERVITDDYNL